MRPGNSIRSPTGLSDALSRGSEASIPDFRRELDAFAPGILDKFDSIIRSKDDQIEEYASHYYKAREDLARERTSAVHEPSNTTSSTGENEKNEGASSPDSRSRQTPASSRFDSKGSPKAGTVPQAVRGEHRVPLSDSTGGAASQHKSPDRTAFSRSLTTSETLLTLKVQVRLLRPLSLLKGYPSHEALLEARSIAKAALDFARENGANDALKGRCCFYIGRSYHDPKAAKPSEDARNWFQRATIAREAGYPEGQSAQEYLNRYQSLDLDSRPSTSSSWLADRVNGVWNAFFGRRSDSESPSTPSKPRPEAIRAQKDQQLRLARGGCERIPSFTTLNSTSPSSASTGTQDHHGLKWSPNHPFGKGEIIPGSGRVFEMVQSPEPIYENPEDEDEEEEQHVPNNVLGGLVEAGALSPAMQRSPRKQAVNRRSGSTKYFPTNSNVSDNAPAKRILYVTNPSAPSSPISPYSGDQTTEDKARDASVGEKPCSSFPSEGGRRHSRAQSAFAFSTPPTQFASPSPDSQSEPSSSPRNSQILSRRGGSISMLLKVTGFDGYRKQRDEAAQMEEGQSPLKPRPEEEGLYRRRTSDAIDEDV